MKVKSKKQEVKSKKEEVFCLLFSLASNFLLLTFHVF
jgi:hypothetical protein